MAAKRKCEICGCPTTSRFGICHTNEHCRRANRRLSNAEWTKNNKDARAKYRERYRARTNAHARLTYWRDPVATRRKQNAKRDATRGRVRLLHKEARIRRNAGSHSEFEIHAALFCRLMDMGLDVRGEVTIPGLGRADIVIYNDGGKAIEVKRQTEDRGYGLLQAQAYAAALGLSSAEVVCGMAEALSYEPLAEMAVAHNGSTGRTPSRKDKDSDDSDN